MTQTVEAAPLQDDGLRGDPHGRGARLRRRAARAVRRAAQASCSPPGGSARRSSRAGARSTSSPRRARSARAAGRRRAARRLPRPARRDHRADRPQARHQRAQLGREGLHGRLRGRELPHLGQPGRRAREPRRRDRGHDRVHELGGQGVPARRRDRDAARPPARLAPAREAPDDGRRGGLGLAHRLRPARRSTAVAGWPRRAAASSSTCPSWSTTSRRGCGTTRSRSPRTTSGSSAGRCARPS